MGWKVAWSNRMVSLYGGVFAGILLFGLAVVFLAFPSLENSMLDVVGDTRKAAQAKGMGR